MMLQPMHILFSMASSRTGRAKRGMVFAMALALGLLLPSSWAFAAPEFDPNLGTWSDQYQDASGVIPEGGSVGGQPGLTRVVHDGFGRVMTLKAGENTGSYFTTAISPASFDGWNDLFLDYTASSQNAVQIEIWDASQGQNNATKLLGPLSPSSTSEPNYNGKVSLASLPSSTSAIFVRVLFQSTSTGGGSLAPSLGRLKVSFTPLSVLLASLEAPSLRPTRGSIQLRMPVSVSYVNATSYVAYINILSENNNLYNQDAALSFESATLGGLYTAVPKVVHGVTIPAHSVYWDSPNQPSGKTFAYSVTLRSKNGLVNGLNYDFQGKVFAANAAPVTTQAQNTALSSKSRRTFSKTATGTFYVGGEHWARNTGTTSQRTITMVLNPGNWWSQAIPEGAQKVFKPVIWDSFQDFIDKGVTTSGDIEVLDGGTIVTSATNVDGVMVPANSVYWKVNEIGLGERPSFRYKVVIGINAGSGASINVNKGEAGFFTPQGSLASSHTNACSEDCETLHTGLTIKIGIKGDPGLAFGQGDEFSGDAAIRSHYDDHPDYYVSWGDPLRFLMSAGNSALGHMKHTVVYNRILPNWTLESADIPAPGKLWYWTGTDTANIPAKLYSAMSAAGVPTYDTGSGRWSATKPSQPTWIAYEIPDLRSSYCSGPNSPNGITNCDGTEPSSVRMRLTIKPDPAVDVCSTELIQNGLKTGATNDSERGATAHVYGYRDLDNNFHSRLSDPLTMSDWEQIEVRPLVPDLSNSFGQDDGAFTPGNKTTHRFAIQNRDKYNNPVDSAENVVATFTVPEVKVNGLLRRLDVDHVDSSGGSINYVYDASGQLKDIKVSWANLPPNSTKNVQIVYNTPTGIKNQTLAKTLLALAADEDCGPVKANASAQSHATSEPTLVISKDLDYHIVDASTPVTYTLSYQNVGNAPSEKTWVIDHIDTASKVLRAKVDVGEVWYSNHLPPYSTTSPLTGGLPSGLVSDFQFQDAIVRAHFKPGVPDPTQSGWVLPSSQTPNPTWVAFLVDSEELQGQAISPGIFPTGLNQKAYIQVQVKGNASVGQLVVNEPAIVAETLEQTIGERVNFIVSPNPGVELAKSCDEVVSNGEELTYTILFRNNTTNLDDTVVLEDTLPEGFVFDPATGIHIDGEGSYTLSVDGNGREVLTLTFTHVNDQNIRGVTLTGHIEGIASGTVVKNQVLATSTNAITSTFAFDDCATLIQNTDLSITKLVDNPQPVSGDIVTYTVSVTNDRQRDAENVVVHDVLPLVSTPSSVPNPLTYVPGSFQVLGNAYSLVSSNGDLQDLVFQKTGHAVGTVPGGLSPETFRFVFKAQVNANVGPGKTIVNRAYATTETGEECADEEVPAAHGEFCPPGVTVCCLGHENEVETPVTTPWPDPYVQISSTSVVDPGDIATWTILYGNDSPERAEDPIIYFTMPSRDGQNQGDADFLFQSAQVPTQVPNAVSVFYSAAPLDQRPAFSATTPGGPGWSSTPISNGKVNHLAFYVDSKRIEAFGGPFSISVNAEARSFNGDLPGIGGTFSSCAEITMLNPAIQDDDPSNNGPVCASTVTPGVGIAVKAECSPDGKFPGLAPEEVASFTVHFENNGTVPNYGVKLTVDLDPRLEVISGPSGPVTLEDASGQEVSPLGPDGFRLGAAPSWGQIGNSFYLGGDEQNAIYYAMAPKDKGSLSFQARVRGNVLDSTDLSNSVDAEILGRPEDEAEIDLSDNQASCGVTVYRADVMTDKAMANASSPQKAVADGGDILTVVITYDNIGRFDASGVEMTDILPGGMSFVSGSVYGIPDGAVVEYMNASGNWNYQPTAAIGDIDPEVRAVRIRYLDGVNMTAPASGGFYQESTADFQEGSGIDHLVLEPGGVTLQEEAESGSYASPLFPADDEGELLDLGILSFTVTFGEDADGNTLEGEDMVIYVEDETGAILAEYRVTGGSGTYSYDLRELALDPSTFEKLRLRVEMEKASGSCIQDIVPNDPDFLGLPTGISDLERIIGMMEVPASEGSTNFGAFTWTEEEGLTNLHERLPHGGQPITSIWGQSMPTSQNEAGTIVGIGRSLPHKYSTSEVCDRYVGVSTGRPRPLVWNTIEGEYEGDCLPPPELTGCGIFGIECPEGFECQEDLVPGPYDGGGGLGGTCISTNPQIDPLVYIPEGEFWMGCNEALDGACQNSEKPQHLVHLSAYAISQTPVTAEAYRQCVAAEACEVPGSGSKNTYHDPDKANHPVNYVNWDMAKSYCEWQGMRLPTEAEWERAARGGCDTLPGVDCKTNMRTYPWGNATPDATLLNFYENIGFTTSVDSYPLGRSSYGLFDMSGNVFEWIADWDSANYYSSSPNIDPSGPSAGSHRGARGGDFTIHTYTYIRSSSRNSAAPGNGYDNISFRCAVKLEDMQKPCGSFGIECPIGFTCSNEAAEGTSYEDGGNGGFCISDKRVFRGASDPGTGAGIYYEEDPTVFVPRGEFWMGCNEELQDYCEQTVELPQHHVTLTKSYAIDQTYVTAGQYRRCVEAGICPEPAASGSAARTYSSPEKGNHPVNFVSKTMAEIYCQWKGARLPTEAEWEKAARGGCETLPGSTCKTTMRTYPWGETAPNETLLNYNNNVGTQTSSVLDYQAGRSPYGLFDMAGNVQAIVGDGGSYRYTSEPKVDPINIDYTSVKLRGSHFKDSQTRYIQTSARSRGLTSPDVAGFDDKGFRCMKPFKAPNNQRLE